MKKLLLTLTIVLIALFTIGYYSTDSLTFGESGNIKKLNVGGSGTVTSVGVTTANGVSGTVTASTTDARISLSLGAITPTTINTTGTVGIGTVTVGRGYITTVGDITIPFAKTETSTRHGLFIGGNDAVNPLGASFDIMGGASAGVRSFNIQATEAGTSASNLNLNPEGGSVGIGTFTPTQTVQLQVTNTSANATSSIEIGKTGQNKGSCLVMYDQAGTVQYVSIKGGTLNTSATSCK